MVLLSDEIYRHFCFDRPVHFAGQIQSSALVVDGFSKTYAIPGWRLGFAHGPAAIIREMIKLQQFSFVCAPNRPNGRAPGTGCRCPALHRGLPPANTTYVDGLRDLYDLTVPGGASGDYGWLNGTLVTRLTMPPFIVTLGTLSIIGALNTYYSHSETIGMQDIEDKAYFLQIMGNQVTFGSARIMWGTFLLLLIAAVVWYILNRTPTEARLCDRRRPGSGPARGHRHRHILRSVYTLAGVIAAIAGWALIGRVGAISPTAGENANLDSITAVVIGGTSLFGGRGSIIGTLVGALIVGVFRSAVSLAGLDVLWQEFAIGVLIIVAVALDQWIRRVSK